MKGIATSKFKKVITMTLIYLFNEKEYTLEQLIEKFPEIWESSLKREYEFQYSTFENLFENLIIEASDEFEEELLALEHYVDFKRVDDEDFDLNVLLKPLLRSD